MSRRKIDRFRLANCGFIFQGFNLFPALTASQQVQIVLKFMRKKKSDRRKRSRKPPSPTSILATASGTGPIACPAARNSASPLPARSPRSRS
jgi:hypothetical protein